MIELTLENGVWTYKKDTLTKKDFLGLNNRLVHVSCNPAYKGDPSNLKDNALDYLCSLSDEGNLYYAHFTGTCNVYETDNDNNFLVKEIEFQICRNIASYK